MDEAPRIVRRGKRHGLGVPSKDRQYMGQWLEGKRHGYGVFRWHNDQYNGQFMEDKYGCGIYQDNDGSVYEGQYLRG